MIVEQLLGGELDNFTYILIDEKSKLAVVIDPVEAEKILEIAKERKLKIKYIINTHSHFNHVVGNEEIKRKTNAKVVMHKNSKLKKDIEVEDGDVIKVGELKINIIHTSGHSSDSICLLVDDMLFTGDTLFVESCERTDLPGGSYRQLINSLRRLMKLDEKIIIYPGHHYSDKKFSTIREEKKLIKLLTTIE